MADKRIVIIGGCGFVGIHLTLALAKKDYMVLVLDVAGLPQSLLYQSNILYQQYDILLSDHLPQILNNFKPNVVVDIAGWGMSGPDMLRQRCFWINDEGTENVLNACQSCGIDKFIFTSTYNVVFCGKPIENGNETLPYAGDNDHLDKYSASKAAAEKKVLQRNGQKMKNGKIFMCSVIRPAAIYGEDERRHLPRILEHIDADFFQFRIGTAIVDWVHVDNLVQAYLLLIEKMQNTTESTASPAGQVYCISDGSPIDNFIFLKPLCEARGKKFPKMIIPPGPLMFLSRIFEAVYHFFDSIGVDSWIPLTRAEIAKVSVTHYFSIEKAKKELGYQPTIDSTTGAARLALHYSKWSDDNFFQFSEGYWYVLIGLGMYLTYRVGFFPSAANSWILGYEYIEKLSLAMFRKQEVVQWVFYGAVLTHIGEAMVAFRIANNCFKNTKYLWFLQTFLLGYPSLKLALARSTRNPDSQL